MKKNHHELRHGRRVSNQHNHVFFCDPGPTVCSLADFDQRNFVNSQDDPGRLIETAFFQRDPIDDPETYLLAWLTVFPRDHSLPQAAARLALRLSQKDQQTLSDWQTHFIELLHFIAAHRPHPRPITSNHKKLHQTKQKGKS